MITVRRVYGEPYEKEGVTVIPAARVQGGAGGGTGEGPQGQGGRDRDGLRRERQARGRVRREGRRRQLASRGRREPRDHGAQIVAILALLVARSIAKSRAKRID